MTGVVDAAAGRDALAAVIAPGWFAEKDADWSKRPPVIYERNEARKIADAVLASSWLEGVLAAERERVAVAIEAEAEETRDAAGYVSPERRDGYHFAMDEAARIARAAVSAPTGGGAL